MKVSVDEDRERVVVEDLETKSKKSWRNDDDELPVFVRMEAWQ